MTLALPSPREPDIVASARAQLRSLRSKTTYDEALVRCVRAITGNPKARVGDYSWSDVDLDGWNAIVAALAAYEPRGRPLAPTTINQTLAHVRGVLRMAYVKGLISDRQWAGIQIGRGVTGTRITKGRALSDTELRRLLTACAAASTPKGPMLRAVLMVGIGTGLRASELCYSPRTRRGLTIACVRNDTELRVVGKGDREKTCVVDAVTRRELDAWLLVRRATRWRHDSLFGSPRGGWLTPNRLWKLMAWLCRRAGIDLAGPHDLRRTFATRMFEAGLGLEQVRQLMAHADPKTTMRYDKRAHALLVARRQEVTVFDPGGDR